MYTQKARLAVSFSLLDLSRFFGSLSAVCHLNPYDCFISARMLSRFFWRDGAGAEEEEESAEGSEEEEEEEGEARGSPARGSSSAVSPGRRE